jgi:methanogenic corrinoid protein MtbC1
MKYETLLEALLAGDRKQSSKIVHEHINQNDMSVRELYETMIKPALYEVGDMWQEGKISVATEHLASAIVEAILNELYYRVVSAEGTDEHSVVVSCVENEYHQIGIKMVADVFEMNGWNAHFLGANTPTRELIRFIDGMKPDLLALSVSIYFHIPDLEKMIQNIRYSFADIQILVGGQAFRHGGREVLKKYPNVYFIPDLPALEYFINGAA